MPGVAQYFGDDDRLHGNRSANKWEKYVLYSKRRIFEFFHRQTCQLLNNLFFTISSFEFICLFEWNRPVWLLMLVRRRRDAFDYNNLLFSCLPIVLGS